MISGKKPGWDFDPGYDAWKLEGTTKTKKALPGWWFDTEIIVDYLELRVQSDTSRDRDGWRLRRVSQPSIHLPNCVNYYKRQKLKYYLNIKKSVPRAHLSLFPTRWFGFKEIWRACKEVVGTKYDFSPDFLGYQIWEWNEEMQNPVTGSA